MFSQALKGDSTSMSEKAASVYNSYRSTKQRMLKSMQETEEDKKCLQLKNYGIGLNRISGGAEQAFLNLDNDMRSMGASWNTVAENLGSVADFETEEGNERAAFCLNALKDTATKVAELSENPESLSTFTTIKLRDLFDDLAKYGQSTKECVEGREELYYQLKAEEDTLESREKSLTSMEGSKYVYNKEARMEATKQSIEESKQTIEDSTNELTSVTDRLQSEVATFQKDKPRRIEQHLMSFADFQIEHMSQMVKYWQELKDELSG